MASANRQTSDDGRTERIVNSDDERLSALIADDDVAILATLDRDASRDELVDSFGELSREVIEILNARERDRELAESDRLIADGGVEEPDIFGVASSSTVDVDRFAEDLEIGSTIAYDSPRGVLAGEVLGFSTWDQHYGKPVVEIPDELEDVLDGDLLVVREEDLVDGDDVEELVADGGTRSVGGWILVPGDVWEATVAYDGYTYETLCGVEIDDWQTWQEERPQASETYEVCIECVEILEDNPELITDGGRVVEERDPCSECEERPAAVGDLCVSCHNALTNGVATDGGVDQLDPVDDLGLPTEIARYVPDRDVTIKAKEVLEDLQLGRPRVKRVLEVAYGSRRPRDLDPEDLLSTLEHSGGRLALISSGNTGVTVYNWIGDDLNPFQIWTYSAIDESLDRESVGRIETYRDDVKARIRYAAPSVVDRSETPLSGGE